MQPCHGEKGAHTIDTIAIHSNERAKARPTVEKSIAVIDRPERINSTAQSIVLLSARPLRRLVGYLSNCAFDKSNKGLYSAEYITVWEKRNAVVRKKKDRKSDSKACGVRRRRADGTAAAMATLRDRRESACVVGRYATPAGERSGSDSSCEFSFFVDRNTVKEVVTVTIG